VDEAGANARCGVWLYLPGGLIQKHPLDEYSNCMQSLCRRLENLNQSMDDDGDDNGFHICAANSFARYHAGFGVFCRVVNAIIG
jgi:hypothetical protein